MSTNPYADFADVIAVLVGGDWYAAEKGSFVITGGFFAFHNPDGRRFHGTVGAIQMVETAVNE